MSTNTYSLPVFEVIRTSWEKVKGAKGTIWAVVGIFFAIGIVLSLLGHIPGLKSLISIVNIFFQAIYSGCLMYVGIRRAQDAPIQYGMIKDVLDMRTILCLIGVILLQFVFLIPAIIIAIIATIVTMPENPHAMPVLGNILFIVAFIYGLIVIVRTIISNGFVVDKKLNSWQAVKSSFCATKCNFWKIIGLLIMCVLISAACIITIGIGYIWGVPLLTIMLGDVYRRLSGTQTTA